MYLAYNARIAATNFGYTLYMITIPAYSFVLSGSILFTGLVLFVEYGIYAVTFVTGPIVDRVRDKRFLIAASQAGIGISAILLGLLMHGGNPGRVAFLILVGVIALCWDFVWTADYTVLPLIVEKEELGKANGYSSAIGNSHVAGGLAAGGILFVYVGAYGSMIVYSASLFLACILTVFVPLVVPEEERKSGRGFLDGWRYIIRKNRTLLWLTLEVSLFSFFGTAPALGITRLFAGASDTAYAIMFSLYYSGAMGVGILLGRFFPDKSMGKAILLTLLISGVLLAISVRLEGYLLLDALIWLLLGFAFTARYTLYATYLQKVTSRDMLGRTASNLYTFRGIASASGTLAIPILITSMGLQGAFLYFGAVIALASVILFAVSPGLRGISVASGSMDAEPAD